MPEHASPTYAQRPDPHLSSEQKCPCPDRGDGNARHFCEPATTNLYLYRLCKSVVSARGGALTGSWTPERRRALGARLIDLPAALHVVPLRVLAYRMAEIADGFRVSTRGAEAVAASEFDGAPLCVWSGDDGAGIRVAVTTLGMEYRTIDR